MPPELGEIEDLVALHLGRRRVAADDRVIEDLGAESIDLVTIVSAVEERWGISIEESLLPDIRTVRDLWTCVREHLAGGP
jgi:acyl carrier protein